MTWLWIALVLAASAGGWWFGRRGSIGAASVRSAPTVRPERVEPRISVDREQALLRAFRSDEFEVPVDAEREDRAALQRALHLLAEHVGAQEAVLWEPDDDGARLEPFAWSRGDEPPALGESERALIEWAAAEGTVTFSGESPGVRLLAFGAKLGERRGAVSVHFREDPQLGRSALAMWVERHAQGLARLHEVLRTRAELAKRNAKLRYMIRTATTMQGSRDPSALERMIVQDACVVSGCEWAMLVRWYADRRVGALWTASAAAPPLGERLEARQGSLAGEVCLSGAPRLFTDARAVVASGEPLFDGTPVPTDVGSLFLVPVRRSDQELPLGALICGHSGRNALRNHDAHAARDLGVIAAGALETAWAMQEATTRARTDQLTGLPNRRHFEEQFARMIGETDRYGGSAGLVLVDVDFFKNVNDTYGHEAGDQVLKAIGHALTTQRRNTDFAARLGGEELALLLPQTDQVGALEVAERCRGAIEATVVRTTAGEIRVTASFGVAMYTARSGEGGRLYELADKALYAAKHAGRNRVELAAAHAPWSG